MSILVFLAQAPMSPNARLGEALTLMGVGMAVVFSALVLLWIVIALTDRLADWHLTRRQPATAETAPGDQEPSGAMADTDHDPHLIAVLTAAATAALGTPTRVKRVHFLGREDQGWAQEGRRLVMTSHQPHLHKRRS